MPLGLRHTTEAKLRIGIGAKGKGRGGFNVKTNCPDCNKEMSPANVGRHFPACQKTKRLTRVFGRRPTTAEQKVFERCIRTYGLDTEHFLRLMDKQEWRCAICSASLESTNGRRATNVDHDHATGAVRGILCMLCNVMLGSAADSAERLERAAQHLKYGPEGPI